MKTSELLSRAFLPSPLLHTHSLLQHLSKTFPPYLFISSISWSLPSSCFVSLTSVTRALIREGICSCVSKMGEYKSPKKPKFRWDDHRRQVLCCLYRFFSRDEDDFKRVFSEIFREHLVECGFEDGTIPYRVLYTQWMWMRRVEHPIWCQVHLESAFKSDGKCEDTIQVIKSTANWLGISLVERDHDPVDMSQHNSLISDKKAIQILESVLIKVRAFDIQVHPLIVV